MPYASGAFSVSGVSKDTDLQAAELQGSLQAARAAAVAQEFGMSSEAASQLTQIADRMQAMAVRGQMTEMDRAAFADSALAVAGVTGAQVNDAVASAVRAGSSAPIDDLITQAAKNLGMSSSAGLRDRILPALGIRF